MRKCLFLLLLVFTLSACALQLNQPAIAPSPSPSPKPQGTQIPVTWSDLKLTGKLVYIGQEDTPDRIFMTIQSLDLQTGQLSTIFRAPDQAWIYALTFSPDYKQLIMSYASPTDKAGLGVPALYTMPADGSQPPKLLFAPPSKDDQYFQPFWASVSGKDYVYYAHAISQGPSKAGTQNLSLELYRMALPNGQPEKLARNAFWPTVSANGSRLVYVAIDENLGTNKLVSADPDGSNAHEVAATGDWVPHYIDAPHFLPDDKTILFSAVSISQSMASKPSWLDALLGVTVASAHNVPSDWWSVSADGGPVTQLTHLQTTALFASLLPDQQHIASYSGGGLFVMNLDGSGVQMLDKDTGGIPSSLQWIP